MKNKAFFIIQLSAFFVFIGRAYQFYFFGAPYRNILWDEGLLSPIVEGVFNTSWYDYATSETVNYWIEFSGKLSSFIFLFAALVSIFWKRINNVQLKKIAMYLGLIVLIFLGICNVKSKNYDILQFFELSIQFGAPFLLLISKNNRIPHNPKLILGLKILIALVFISHGLFAMGLIYVPGHFVDMSIKILGVTETQAKQLLFVAGFLDVVASILIFIPRISRYAFYYIIAWGLITALARTVYGFSADFVARSLHHSIYLTLYRLPNGLFPLATYILYTELNKSKSRIQILNSSKK